MANIAWDTLVADGVGAEQVAAKATFLANLYVWELMAVPTFHIQFFHNMDFCRYRNRDSPV